MTFVWNKILWYQSKRKYRETKSIFIVPFLGSALGYLVAMCSPGWRNLVAFDWNDLPVGREIFEKCQIPTPCPASPPHPPSPPPAGLTLIGALQSLSPSLSSQASVVQKVDYLMDKVFFSDMVQYWFPQHLPASELFIQWISSI